jgi:serine/threonine-protein kinase RsbW
MSGNVTIEFPSDYKFLNIVDLVTAEVVQNLCFNHQAANEIGISVIEACTNAIEHGNRERPEANVRLVFHCTGDRLVIEVCDRGKGFDFKGYLEHIPDPANIQHLRGRGIYIMKNMMDGLEFEMVPGKGMTVRLVKRIPADDAGAVQHG